MRRIGLAVVLASSLCLRRSLLKVKPERG